MGERLGRYELTSRLGVGGMAEVFLARSHGSEAFSRPVVIKRLLPAVAAEPENVRMFLDEARLGSKLRHPCLVPVLDLGDVDGTYYMVMEHVDGADLGVVESRARSHAQPLPLGACAWVVARAAEGLHAAHNAVDPETRRPLQVVHRDISPSNILLSRAGDVKVADFGVARSSAQESRTATGAVKGKLSYMAPEQVEARPLDARTDVYALGVVLFELVTRRRLYQGMNQAQVVVQILDSRPPQVRVENPDVDRELEGIILKAMAKNPVDRFPNARAMQDVLDAWAARAGFATRSALERFLEERTWLFDGEGSNEVRTTPVRSPKPISLTQEVPSLRKVGGTPSPRAGELKLAQKGTEKKQDVLLYVEDEADNREVASLRLRRRYDLLLAENDEQACEILTTRGPELSAILMDIQLKGSVLDGIQLVKLLRGKLERAGLPAYAARVPVLKDVPVLFVTAYAARYTEADLLAAGGNRLVTKPVNFGELTLALVDLHLKRATRS